MPQLSQTFSKVQGGYLKFKKNTLPIRAPITAEGNRLLAYIMMVTFFLLPMYVFRPGGPQLVDIPLLLLTIIAFSRRHELDDHIKKLIISFIPFVTWVFIVNSGYYVVYHYLWELLSTGAIILGLIQLYILSIVFNNLLTKNKINYIYLALILSIIGCFIIKGKPVEVNEYSRNALSFFNPNQLAYFSIILLCYEVLLFNFRKIIGYNSIIYTIFDVIIILFAHYFVLLGMSRAGIFAALALDICLLKNMVKNNYFFPAMLAILGAATFLLVIHPTFIQERMEVRDLSHFSASGVMNNDGLKSRFLEPFQHVHGVQFLIGVGPGAIFRENYGHRGPINPAKMRSNIEVHNMFGDITKSYGFIGIILFGYWFIKIIIESRKINDGLWIMAALFMYNFAHNGIRFRSFYIFMAFLIVNISLQQQLSAKSPQKQINSKAK